MPKAEDRSDYVLGRFRNVLRNVAERATGTESWVDDDGKRHYRRRVPYVPPPIVIPPPPPPPPPPPATGQLGRIKHDYEVYGMSRPEFNDADGVAGLPETIKAADSVFLPLSSAWQFYSFDLLRKANPQLSRDEAVQLFKKVYRANAFKTNQKAPPKEYCNFVTGEGSGYEPMKTEMIWTGGALLKIIGEGKARGIDCWKVEALDIHKAPPSLDDFDGVHQTPVIYLATTSNRANNGTLVIPLTGGPNVPIPFVADKGWALIDKKRVELLPEGAEPPDPYHR